MNIAYLDFWPGFDPNCNWFNLLFSDYFDSREINFGSDAKEADVIVFSSFGLEHLAQGINKKAIKIFYTGENHRPPHYCDFSFSFDIDSYGGKNLRLPIWYLYINWWNQPDFPHARITPEMLIKKWDPDEVLNRENFCSIVIGNPVKNRIEVAQKLNQLAPVHGHGAVFGNSYSGDKVKLLERYKYNICFENTIADGYVTEKLLEAKTAGCIPIYYGDRESVARDFNYKSFINFYDYKNAEELFDYILTLEKNKEMCYNILNEKLFNENPTLDFIYNFLNKNRIGG
jgi:hypothetical protein